MTDKIAVILYGPPGSGKGTQAKLLAEKLNLFPLDTGEYLRKILYDPKFKNDKKIQFEKKINEAGKLNSPAWVLNVVKKRVKELAKLDQSVVFSGSPRTWYEAFGSASPGLSAKMRDKKDKSLLQILEKLYGKNNIFTFILQIPEKETLKRNSKRSVCSVCRASLMAFASDFKICPFCGGKIEYRKDDKKEIIIERLKEYRERTKPIFNELKKKKYRVVEIDGTPAPYKIHQKLLSYLTRNK